MTGTTGILAAAPSHWIYPLELSAQHLPKEETGMFMFLVMDVVASDVEVFEDFVDDDDDDDAAPRRDKEPGKPAFSTPTSS
jgi:hypothetical protein